MKLTRIKSNFYHVNHNGKTIWFSYGVPIGFLIVSKCEFFITNKFYSKTTSLHKNLIARNIRIPHDEFLKQLEFF